MGVDFESVTEATSGAIGGLVSTTILYPLDTCKTKYQAEVHAGDRQKYRSVAPAHACLRIHLGSVLCEWVLQNSVSNTCIALELTWVEVFLKWVFVLYYCLGHWVL
jgi:hypothetical protein